MWLVEFHEQLGDSPEVHVNLDGEHRLAGTGLRFAFERQWHRENEIVVCIVRVDLVAQVAEFATLLYDHNARFVEHGHARERVRGAHERDVFQLGGVDSVARRMLRKKIRHLLPRGEQSGELRVISAD